MGGGGGEGAHGVGRRRCLVCQCEYEGGDEIRALPCDHEFHKECIDGWLADHKECPLCKASVSTPTKAADGAGSGDGTGHGSPAGGAGASGAAPAPQ